MLKQGYNYSPGMMTDIFLHDEKLAGATADSLLVIEDGRRVLKASFNLTILDGWHRLAAVTSCARLASSRELQASYACISSISSCVEMEPILSELSPQSPAKLGIRPLH